MAYDPLSLLTPRRLPVSAVDQYAQGLLGYQKTDPLSALSGMPDMTDATLLQPTQRSPGFMSSLGNAFTGTGSSARLQALGAALLSGPSRTPISFGSQLAKGLLAGTQLAEEQKQAELKRSLLEREQQYKEDLLGYKTSKLNIPEISDVKGYNLKTGTPEALRSSKDPQTGQITYTYLSSGKPVDWNATGLSKPELGEGAVPKVSTNVTPLYMPDGSVVNAFRVDQNGQVSWQNAVTNEPITGSFSLETQKFDLVRTKPFQNKKTGENEYIFESNFQGQKNYFIQDENGEMQKINFSDFKEITDPEVLAASIPKAEKIYEWGNNANEISVQTQPLLNLMYNVDRAKQSGLYGGKGWIQGTIGKIKTAVGSDLTDEQALRLMLTSNQAQVVGQSRLEILGPGVLSNQDVDFLFNALGGRVDSIFANPEILTAALQQLYASKVRKYKNAKQQYDGNKQFLQGRPIDVSPVEFFVNIDNKPRKVTGFVNPDYFAEGGTMLGIENMIRNNDTEKLKRVLVM